ncbi:uncharacterized protein CELE_F40F8.5 [Caenorhabditis elegans]|uniref:Secreted protein n=1 Tax=Caenorhabditis elegans TaxID=6239 RepID=H2L296_CAEEL|nr:Secreted protein [Caenorhabditis elegans]CCE71542.1 Secreted protein [Caenorhabditis elegans]|eukprot:NP_001254280.1 Uncharacterized protein CELE_F40F8.5 [Caenorhabditis elegans]
MIVRISLLASLLVISTIAFECSPDTILRMATNKREKQLERECHEQKTSQAVCETKEELEKSWKDFQKVSNEYKEAVTACRKYVEEKSRPKRTVLDGDMGEPTEDQEDTNDHARRRRHHNHEGHHGNDMKHRENMDRKKHGTHVDHHGRVRRNGDHDPNDPNVDHTGHNHRVKRSIDDDPSDTTIDHTGHNHRRRRSDDHDPNDPNVDHTGHNHKRRHVIASRSRRTVCSTAGHDQLSAMSSKFTKHCERENICLPDEDLPKGKQQDDILALQKLRAKKYSEYLTQVSKCYGKL